MSVFSQLELFRSCTVSVEDGSDQIEATREYLRFLYFQDGRPWVIAFSGGKDSTLVLQLVYEMLLENISQRNKPIYILSSDTKVEPPNIAEYLKSTLDLIRTHAQAHHLPIQVELVQPNPDESFWGKLIGKGYPSPTRWFRWCTSNMKIRPTRRVIESITSEWGSVVLLLGSRLAESSDRSRRMGERQTNERGLNPHHEIPNALVATPLLNWSTRQVWEYLLSHTPPPWGGTHDFMMDLYRQAGGGECPLVLDLDTPPCGGSRFGCWTCTVVKEDKSMLGFIDSGEAWMEPLYRFRNWLKEIREDPSWRMSRRRDGSVGQGAFLPEKRRVILDRLLRTEQEVGQRLIGDDEIAYIQEIWSKAWLGIERLWRLGRRSCRVGPCPTITRPVGQGPTLPLAMPSSVNSSMPSHGPRSLT